MIKSFIVAAALANSLGATTLAAIPDEQVGREAAAGEGEVRLTLIPKGASAKIGHYRPQRAIFGSDRLADVTKQPADLAAPGYGRLPFGAKGVLFILDEPEDGPASLYVDTNGNGDLTDDGAAEWTGKTTTVEGKSTTSYAGTATVTLAEAVDGGTPATVTIQLYRFDKNDPSRASLKSVVLFYRDYAYEGSVVLGGTPVNAMLTDDGMAGFASTPPAGASADAGSGVSLLLDVNGNGKFDHRGESFDVIKPFNIGGTTYEVTGMAPDGSAFQIVKSSKTVAEISTPPDLSRGKPMASFTATDLTGKPVRFPDDYKGKVVLVDFWATWCGPCMHEMPSVVKAYEAHHASGFEVLGISLDNEQSLKKIPEVTAKAKMTWRQIADGKGWKAELAEKFAINSIPATFLVDGSTGVIIGTNLRGDALEKAVAEAIGNAGAPSTTGGR